MAGCIFCTLSKKKSFWEDKYYFAIIDIYPVSPGHALLIPKRHIVSLLDLGKSEWISLKDANVNVIKKIGETDLNVVYKNIIKKYKDIDVSWFCNKALHSYKKIKIPAAYNLGCNDGIGAGRTVDHLHWHIIPRYQGDAFEPIGGIRYVIPGMGNYRRSNKNI